MLVATEEDGRGVAVDADRHQFPEPRDLAVRGDVPLRHDPLASATGRYGRWLKGTSLGRAWAHDAHQPINAVPRRIRMPQTIWSSTPGRTHSTEPSQSTQRIIGSGTTGDGAWRIISAPAPEPARKATKCHVCNGQIGAFVTPDWQNDDTNLIAL